MHRSQNEAPVRRLFSSSVALLAAVSAAACATIPSSKTGPAPKPASAYAASQSLAAPAAAWPARDWWTRHEDPQLTALITEALAEAPDMRAADARLRKAAATRSGTRANLLPSVQAVGSANKVHLEDDLGIQGASGDHQGGFAGLELSWELDFWGKNRAALAAATSEEHAAKAERDQAELVLSTAIAGEYANLARLYADRDAAAEAVSIRRQTFELMAARQAKGLENAGAAERARSGAKAAQAELAAVDEEITNTRHGIAALLGKGPDRGLALQRPTAQALISPGLPANLPAELLGRRPDIVAARLRAEAAASRIKVAKASFYPNVNLGGFLGGGSLSLEHVARSGSLIAAVGPAVSLPIFDGGRLRAQYRGSQADYDLAVAEYDRTVAHALNEVADAVTSRRDLQLRLGYAQEALVAANTSYAVANNRYRGGLSTYLDVLTAEDSLISARRQVARLETRAFALDVAMVRALGGDFQS